MGPRSSISTFAIRPFHASRINVLSRRHIHIQANARPLRYYINSQGITRCRLRLQGEKASVQARRHKSSAASAAASTSQYGREAPPPAKTSTTKLPKKSSATNSPLKNNGTPSNHARAPPALLSKQPQVPIYRAKEQLNPPSFTHAPELTVPARKSDQGFLSYIWKAGRSYLTFYKSGVSNVRQTSKLARTLRDKASRAAPRPTTDVLTRAEWQIVQRSRKDMLRLPAFGLIFLVCGEWTPLLVMYMTPLIPEPCRIPSQVQRELAKLERTRHARQNMRPSTLLRLAHKARKERLAPGDGADVEQAQMVFGAEEVRKINPLDASHLVLVLMSARYNCHSRFWDWVRVTPPKFWLQRNVRKKLEYLKTDDQLIERDGGYRALDKAEVERACVERGMDVQGLREEALRMELAKWWKGGLPRSRAKVGLPTARTGR